MIYIGMDVSSKSFVVHAINEKRRKIFSGEIPSTRVGLSFEKGFAVWPAS